MRLLQAWAGYFEESGHFEGDRGTRTESDLWLGVLLLAECYGHVCGKSRHACLIAYETFCLFVWFLRGNMTVISTMNFPSCKSQRILCYLGTNSVLRQVEMLPLQNLYRLVAFELLFASTHEHSSSSVLFAASIIPQFL